MSKLALTLSSRFVAAFLAETEVPPAEADALLSEAGILPCVVREPGGRVTEEQFAALYRLIATRFDDELPNLLSHPLRGGAMKFVGLGIINAPTLAVALHRYSQIMRLMVHDYLVVLSRGANTSTVQLAEERGRRAKTMGLEMALKVIHGLSSWLVRRELPLIRVDFSFDRPDYADEFQNLFPGPVHFNEPVTQFVFESHYLSLPVQRSVSDLRVFLARQPQDWISIPFAERLAKHQVRDYLLNHNLSKASIDDIARDMNISSRTLFRRLEAEGSSFQQVKDELRRDLAIDQLTNTHDTVAEIAYRLGFNEVSSFYRAFRSWTGTTPSSYRKGA